MTPIAEIFTQKEIAAIHAGAPTPLYYRLYCLLKNSILTGTIEHGAQMPTELILSETFGVSRITAKRAMDELADEQLIERRRGKGSHVIHKYRPQPVKAPLTGMLQEIESMARHSDVKVIECREKLPPANIRTLMELPENKTILHTIRVRSKEREPFGYYESWTQGLKKKVTAAQFQKIPRLAIFRRQGVIITHVTQTISAVAADANLADALTTDIGAPLISLTRHSYAMDPEEKLMDYLQLYYHPDRFQYQMDLRLED
ncbi:MAG: GntR family transcriptional regulator [Haliea sp.]